MALGRKSFQKFRIVEPDKMPSVEVADRRTPRGSERANWKKQTL